jgi:hypothetical protein
VTLCLAAKLPHHNYCPLLMVYSLIVNNAIC